jgi:hypothetical protein
MEEITERLVQNDKGLGQTAADVEIFPTELELAAAVDTGERPFVAPEPETVPDEAGIPEAVEGDKPQSPPAGYENVPQELWPDANGNPPQLTEKLLSKLRGKYFTVKHPRLTDCGHLLDMINQPKNNCQTCWWTWFNSHPQLIEVADQFFRTHGKNAMISMRGEKFVKMFLRFMSTVHHFMEQERLKNANNSERANTDSVDGDTARFEDEGGRTIEATDEGGEVKSRGISSGLHEQNV